MERWNRESYDLHVVQKVGRTALELFESEEAGALNERLQQALPEKWSYTQLLDTLLTDEVERRDFKHHRAHERGVVLGQFLPVRPFGRYSSGPRRLSSPSPLPV